jgi:5-methylcytosine-specific restriction endonuclease McrA
LPIRPENRHRYGPDWPQVRAAILQRARVGGLFTYAGLLPRCECLGECGRGTHEGRCPNVNGEPAYGTGSKVVLTIAHLDHTPENNDPANLRALCQGCHLHYDREHHAQTRARTLREAREGAGQLTL